MPSRKLELAKNRGIRIWKLYCDYRQRHAGATGLGRLAARLFEVLARGGLGNLRNILGVYEMVVVGSSSPTVFTFRHETLALEETDPCFARSSKSIAVHAHIYYAELAPEIKRYLENIPVRFDLYVTTDSDSKAADIKRYLAGIEKVGSLDIRVVPNRGRDIGPMLVELGETLVKYEVALHIHTKRSPHNPDLRGWRRYLMQSLLGSPGLVTSILDTFAKDQHLGIFYPQIYHPVIPFMRIGGNAGGISSILKRAGRDTADLENIDMKAFPAGFMLWFRGSAIKPFIRLKLDLGDFDVESGQDDSTLAHAIERMFPYMAAIDGYHSQAYLPNRMLDTARPGAVPLRELLPILSATSAATRIIFDDRLAESANRYSRDLIDGTIASGRTVLRVYYSNGVWFVEWVAADDGMIFVETSTERLFDILSKVGASEVVVNAPNLYPGIDRILGCIVNLVGATGSKLDYKVHDFYAVCPSQNLLKNNDQYCRVPLEVGECNICLQNNKYAHSGSDKFSNINKWREPFVQLLEVASTISIFDSSSTNIMRRALHVEETKLRLETRPRVSFKHVSSINFEDHLCIGVFGTLSVIQGSSIINTLAEYIEARGIQALIKVVGGSNVPVVENIRVLDSYTQAELPFIIQREGINVILMAAISPETYSNAIADAMQLGLPIVAFDIGAQGAHVSKYKLGRVVPLNSSSEVILDAIQSLLITVKG